MKLMFGQKCPIRSVAVDKRGKFIAELRHEAKKRNLTFRVEKDRCKGGHSMVWVGSDKVTTVPGREIDPKTARRIRKTLGLD
jgi:hypothetical protein